MRTLPEWAEKEAWEALYTARRRVPYLDPGSGKVTIMQEWKTRHAPSAGARARSIIRGLLFPPSYIAKCEEALVLYLSDAQNADRRGFYRSRVSNAPQVFTGVQHYG